MKVEKVSHHTFTIDRFRDGDTVEGILTCRCCGSTRRDVIRLLKIESWEPKGPDSGKAKIIAEALTKRYRGETGLLTCQSLRRDLYGRLLADIIIDETALTLQLVEQGYAWWGVGEPNPGIIPFPI